MSIPPGSIVAPLLGLLLVSPMLLANGKAVSLTFEKDVRPILKAQCFHCHGEDEELHGGLDLRLVRLMHNGGDSGEPILSEDVAASYLWQRIESDEMPEGP